MNMGFNGYGTFGTAMTRPDPLKLINSAYENMLKKVTDALPNPRGYYFREGFEKDVAKAEATRNKEILSSSLFNSGVSVGRGSQAGEYYYRNDAAMKAYAIPYDKRYVESIQKAMDRVSLKLKNANYKQLPNGSWVEKSTSVFRDPFKGTKSRGTGTRAPFVPPTSLPGSSKIPGGVAVRPDAIPTTPAGQSFTPSPDAEQFPQLVVTETQSETPWLLYIGAAALIGGGAFFLLRRKKG